MKTPMQTNRMPVLRCVTLIIYVCVCASRPALAANHIWNGGAAPDGHWTTPGNWNGVAPAANDRLFFAGSTQTAATNDYTAGTLFNNLTFNSGASPFTLNGNSLVLSSPTDAGSGQISGGSINNVSAGTQTVLLPLVLASGNHTISSSGGGTLKLNGSLTHSNGAVVTMSGNINGTGALSTNGNNNILGGWAIFNNNWATLDANSNIVAYSGYTDVAPAGTIADNASVNVRIPTAGGAISTTAGTTHINSLLFSGGAAAQTVAVGAGNKLVLGQNGGIFNSSAITSGGTYRNLTIGSSVAAGGILTAGDGINPATITFGSAPLPNASGFCTVNSIITDNGSAPVTVVLAGAYLSMNGGGNAATTNTYSGGTYILQGRISQPGRYTFGFGPVYIVSGGQANLGCQITNDVYLEGSGTVENNGMGALRLYAASAANGYIGNLSGTIHLTGSAAVGANNTAFTAAGAPFIGISGKLTGPGGLMISSPTATANGAGTINLGSTNGTSAIPNDYAGDTTINGTAGGTVNSTLRICNPADNNIMPHGAAGSYAGGATGNLILNATAANRQAIFDLNGSTQTINGLGSTAASPVNNIVTDNTGGGALIVGDNNATATFGGIIQSALTITKIGTGTETLSGANTYTGDTVVKVGTLVASTVATGSGNYSVSNNAALGVSVASPGTTLNMNGLTFGSAATAINLNTGTNGNPIAPIVNVSGGLAMNGNVNLSLSGVGLTAGGPFTVLTYNAGSRTGAGSFVLNNSPRVVATLHDDLAGNVTVTIISADTAVKWNGGSAGNWNINTPANPIWQTVPSGNPTYYIETGSGNDVVLFDDSLTGTNAVNLTTLLTPQGITVSNSAVNYLFTGSGKFTGATGLTKQGTGTLTIANSGNSDFSGPIALNAGTLVISNNSVIANTLSGGGALAKNGGGTLVLSGDGSAYTGPVSVNGGTLSVLNTLSLATASGTTIASGATLDIGNNTVALGLEPLTVAGSGVGAGGAIVNSSGYAGNAVATSFQNLTLAGDTTIGGPGRLDFRSTDPNGGADATLNTGGQPYSLTKVSGNVLQLASVQIDAALANINVQAGTLSFQGNMPSLGNPAGTIAVSSGATLQFNSVSSDLKKILVLNDGAIINNSGGANIFDGSVTLLGNGFFNVGGSSLTFTNSLGGAGSLSKVTGTGVLYLNATNTYTGSTLIGAGGIYLTEPADIRSSAAIAIGSGATLDVTGRSDQMLTVLGGHSLTGSGTLNGSLTNLPASILAPGTPTAIGTFTVNGNASLNGTNLMKLVETNLTSDVLTVNGTLNFGGTLMLQTLAGTLKAGDSFQLFTGGFTGSFASLVPATPGFNFLWDTNTLATTGVLTVIYTGNTTPTNLVTSLNGSSLTLSWPVDHTGWRLQVQTNGLATGLGTNWADIANSGSTNQFVVPVNGNSGSVFYRMVYP